MRVIYEYEVQCVIKRKKLGYCRNIRETKEKRESNYSYDIDTEEIGFYERI